MFLPKLGFLLILFGAYCMCGALEQLVGTPADVFFLSTLLSSACSQQDMAMRWMYDMNGCGAGWVTYLLLVHADAHCVGATIPQIQSLYALACYPLSFPVLLRSLCYGFPALRRSRLRQKWSTALSYAFRKWSSWGGLSGERRRGGLSGARRRGSPPHGYRGRYGEVPSPLRWSSARGAAFASGLLLLPERCFINVHQGIRRAWRRARRRWTLQVASWWPSRGAAPDAAPSSRYPSWNPSRAVVRCSEWCAARARRALEGAGKMVLASARYCWAMFSVLYQWPFSLLANARGWLCALSNARSSAQRNSAESVGGAALQRDQPGVRRKKSKSGGSSKKANPSADCSTAEKRASLEPDPLNLCKICMDDECFINTVLLPCAHRVACETCALALQRCPLCRSTISTVLKTYDG